MSDTALAQRLRSVQERVARAADAADRDPADITTVVVTKFQPTGLLRGLYDLGVRDFGESRHQDAREKAAELPDDIVWHFVGQLQTKKARQVRAYSRVIHSVDRIALVEALTGGDEATGVFAQVDLAGEEGRGGVDPDGLSDLALAVEAAPGLQLLGVMAVAPQQEEPRRAFARLRELSERVRGIAPGATAISAGMSGDLEDALKEGATHLRVGTAITGERALPP
ncbi:MAG: YggS family pyridoxal phosphate-dependent enzyme [Naasia sp.]